MKKPELSSREKVFLIYYGVFFYSLADLLLKIIPFYYADCNIFSMMFFQSIGLIFISYFDIQNFGRKLEKWENLENKFKIIIRGLANCSINLFITLATYHIKYAIIISILFSNNLINSIFSIFYFKEKFHMRYLIGLILSFSGLILFAFSGKNQDGHNSPSEDTNPKLGVFFAFMGGISISTMTLLNKSLSDYHPSILNFYCGVSGSIFSFPFLFFIKKVDFSLGYVFLNFLNTIFFHISSTFFLISLSYNSLILICSVSFSSIIFAFLYGLFIFGENLNFQELFGILVIVSYNAYTLFVPIDGSK